MPNQPHPNGHNDSMPVQRLRCHAKKKNAPEGTTCQRWAMYGQKVCYIHGGNTPQARKKAAVKAELMLWRIDEDKTLDPGEVLLRLVSQSYARVELYSDLLGKAYEAAERNEETVAIKGYTSGVSALIGHKIASDGTGGFVQHRGGDSWAGGPGVSGAGSLRHVRRIVRRNSADCGEHGAGLDAGARLACPRRWCASRITTCSTASRAGSPAPPPRGGAGPGRTTGRSP